MKIDTGLRKNSHGEPGSCSALLLGSCILTVEEICQINLGLQFTSQFFVLRFCRKIAGNVKISVLTIVGILKNAIDLNALSQLKNYIEEYKKETGALHINGVL